LISDRPVIGCRSEIGPGPIRIDTVSIGIGLGSTSDQHPIGDRCDIDSWPIRIEMRSIRICQELIRGRPAFCGRSGNDPVASRIDQWSQDSKPIRTYL